MPEIYHEKQVRELCALHALNNLFQRNAFTKYELDNICLTLSPDYWINPHRSILGLGNYDINVIMKALQDRNYSTIWFDKRKDPACLNLKYIFGFILNVPSDYRLGFMTLPLRRRHWIAIKQINGVFFNLDSKLNTPQPIGKDREMIDFLKEESECKDKQLFIIISSDVEVSNQWMLNKYHTNNRDAEIVELNDIISEDLRVTINPLCNS